MEPGTDYTDLVNNLKTFDVGTQQKAIADSVGNLPDDKKVETIADAAKNLSADQQKAVADSLSPPSPQANDKIWLIVISCFSGVLVLVVVVMSIGWFLGKPFEPSFLTIFTTVSAFLIGLFAKSPV